MLNMHRTFVTPCMEYYVRAFYVKDTKAMELVQKKKIY